jgi:hypothetical protein
MKLFRFGGSRENAGMRGEALMAFAPMRWSGVSLLLAAVEGPVDGVETALKMESRREATVEDAAEEPV